MRIVTLTTDFGLTDPYLGQVKGVILGLCPQAVLTDLTHLIEPRHILQGALVVAESAPYFPAGTIHLAVVDPGVGTERRAMVVQAEGQLFVAPDNGLLTPVIKRNRKARIRLVTNKDYLRPTISPTFHGRDIFAPAAGHLAAGLAPSKLGPKIDDPVLLEWPEPVLSHGRIKGQVLSVDRFGNLITNISTEMICQSHGSKPPRIELGGQSLIGLHLTYAEEDPGQPLALIGGLDLLEIAVNQGRADEFFGLRQGAEVEVTL